jgi:hypothetical protein
MPKCIKWQSIIAPITMASAQPLPNPMAGKRKISSSARAQPITIIRMCFIVLYLLLDVFMVMPRACESL